MRGVKSDDLLAIIDFLYCGEANVYQENLDSFLAIAEELQLKGLMGKADKDEVKESNFYEAPKNVKPVYKREASISRSACPPRSNEQTHSSDSVDGGTVALNTQSGGELHQLLQQSDIMMEKTGRKMQNGKQSYQCKVCGKEGEKSNIIQGIILREIIWKACLFLASFVRKLSVPECHCQVTFPQNININYKWEK